LATKVNIAELVLVAKADFLGRTTKEAEQGDYPAGEWLLERAEALNVKEKPLVPMLQGRDLISMGLKPSPKFKEILEKVYQLQLEGVLESREEALAYVAEHLV
jgi:tRNA nucleotidyltransferase (CCA-adding enzyme)